MSILDQQQLLASIHPFELLTQRVIAQLSSQMDIAYYPNETVLIGPRVEAQHLYIIIKGSVNELIDGELHNVYTALDSFDANALIYNDVKSTFVVQEDLICYLLPKEIFLNLIQDYEPFRSYFMKDFIAKHQSLKERQQQNDLTPFMIARVSDIFLHEPCIVEYTEPIRNGLVKMKELKTSSILVWDNGVFGIITDTDLRDKILLGETALDANAGSIANYPLITIDRNDFLFNALLLFTKHGIKRVAVTEEGEIIGILEQLDLLSHFASHSHLIAVQVNKAESIEELSSIQKEQLYLVQSLNSKGVKVRYISKLVSEINAKVYEKVYELTVPRELREKAALIVMGSEGRHEQVLRTDQDNALIIDESADAEVFTPYMQAFSEHLQTLGFPPCPGQVMVNNPHWRGTVSLFKKRIDGWVESFDENALQALSIFLDAQCISGNSRLLDELTEYLQKRFTGREDILAHMAKSTLSFETPLSIFSGFIVEKSHANEIDLKKGGIFAIVHGIRTLALEYHITQTNTIERIKELNNRGLFDKKFATELIEAFDTLSGIRLKAMLRHPNKLEHVNFINPSKLDKMERDLLKDSFKVVNTFKKFLTYHYHLNMVV
ncbi:putative nucleotidyltransferase substrate binding domain-containing protein [Sulfurimonas sp. HSL3-7]|uniref:putative nucleotidyltransferase substrate binding domain-containing protein n=1 Tax=Sulfonitrofixus jiaomeiensis TaxID=3131938 RepID=UPI0031F87CBE